MSLENWYARVHPLSDPSDDWLTDERLTLARLPRVQQESKWSYYPDNALYKKALLEYIDNLEEYRKKGMGLILYGSTGKGKTCAAVLLAMEIIRRDGHPLFERYSEIARIEMDAEDELRRSKLRDAAFLIIDDFGAGPGKEATAAMVEEILRSRQADRLTTIITTNMDKKEMLELFDEPCVRVIKEICKVIVID